MLRRTHPRPRLDWAGRAVRAALIRLLPGRLRVHRLVAPDRMLIFGQRHLRAILAQYQAHYNGRRPHRSRQLRPPRPGQPPVDLFQERIQRPPVLGGLISKYERAA